MAYIKVWYRKLIRLILARKVWVYAKGLHALNKNE